VRDNSEAHDLSFLLRQAAAHVDAFIARTASVIHDWKGIRPSEGFFMFALLAGDPPARILESGRGRGYSTEILARCFPAARIISIDSDRHSPDVELAAKRLGTIRNVECKFGDARLELPRLVEQDDCILIDGPKDFRALKLAFRLLRTGKPRAVFLHDAGPGTRTGQFLGERVPSALLSDAPEFLRLHGFVGTGEPRPAPGEGVPAHVLDRLLQGAMAYLRRERLNYGRLLAEVTLRQWKERLRDTTRNVRAGRQETDEG
jgi:hypothetical protein